MDAKLTLKLNKLVIEKAKDYAVAHKKSLSGLIESYLKSLVDKEYGNVDENIKISPFVKSMRTGVKIPADLDLKKTYSDYLSEKYK